MVPLMILLKGFIMAGVTKAVDHACKGAMAPKLKETNIKIKKFKVLKDKTQVVILGKRSLRNTLLLYIIATSFSLNKTSLYLCVHRLESKSNIFFYKFLKQNKNKTNSL